MRAALISWGRSARAALVLAAVLAGAGGAATTVAGCFRPSIEDGGFLCADPPAKACPDGFSCISGRCRKGADGGSDTSACVSPPVTPLCDDQPAAGKVCDPACQTNCACGRCNVLGGVAACVPTGPKKLGERCNPTADQDDCGAGLICLEEACGNRLGRCYRHCSRTEQCSDGTLCQIPILDSGGVETGYLSCDIAPQECDPVFNIGCPDPALNCYLTSGGQTLCDCPGSAPGNLGDPCMFYGDCAMGLACVTAGGASRCTAVCTIQNPTCPSGRTCVPSGATYGTCNAN